MPRALASRRIQLRTISQVIRLNGVSDSVSLGALGAIAQTPAAFTLFARFKREALPAIMAMVGDLNNAAQNHVNFQVGTARKLLTTLITTAGQRALVGTNTVPYFVWNDASFSYDGTTLRFYLNGLADNTITHSGTINASTSGMALGTGSAPIGGALRYFLGGMCDVRFWTRVITPKENEDLHFDGRNDTSMREGLAGEWLLAGDGNDTSGGGNNGTVNGSTFDSNDVPVKVRSMASPRSVASQRSVTI